MMKYGLGLSNPIKLERLSDRFYDAEVDHLIILNEWFLITYIYIHVCFSYCTITCLESFWWNGLYITKVYSVITDKDNVKCKYSLINKRV